MAIRMKQRAAKIGEILLASGEITEQQFKEALEMQKRSGQLVGRILVESGFTTEAAIAKALAKQMAIEFVDLTSQKINASATMLVNQDIARRYLAFPIDFKGDDTLIMAVADPTNLLALDDLTIMTGYRIAMVVATEQDIISAINSTWSMGESVEAALQKVTDDEPDVDTGNIRDLVEEAPIVKFVNLIITRAVKERASDIHVEPQERELRIRYRIDGVLHEIMQAPKKIQSGVLSRLKIMADLDIAERRIPQDGRCSVLVEGKAIDLRVASAPTVYGEQIVMRILDKSSVLIDINDLGFDGQVLESYLESSKKPHGCILVTGPTGSGKTTTLYATLNILNESQKKIITVEDPVEYRLNGINQIQANPKAGLSFAAGLRSILRLDPDIVMVGEIRDPETAKIAVEASLTGHLVLSTLHTNDAAGALTRLTEMGIEPFLIGSSVECVLAQRLVRLLCPSCREEYEISEEMAHSLNLPNGWDRRFFKPKGCSSCNNTGYKGRLGIYEVMVVSEAVERLVVERATTDEIKRVATQEGMTTLRLDGLNKAKAGKTSLHEVMRVSM